MSNLTCHEYILTILFNVVELDPLSETGSRDASGDVLAEVDIGDPPPFCV